MSLRKRVHLQNCEAPVKPRSPAGEIWKRAHDFEPMMLRSGVKLESGGLRSRQREGRRPWLREVFFCPRLLRRDRPDYVGRVDSPWQDLRMPRCAASSTTLHRAEGSNLPGRGRCSQGWACPHSARQTRERTPPRPSLRACCPREPRPSASLQHTRTAHSRLRRAGRTGWPPAAVAGALRIPSHPQVSLATPPT